MKVLAVIGWLVAAAAGWWAWQEMKLLVERANKERVMWRQMDRYQRALTPDMGFDDDGNLVRD